MRDPRSRITDGSAAMLAMALAACGSSSTQGASASDAAPLDASADLAAAIESDASSDGGVDAAEAASATDAPQLPTDSSQPADVASDVTAGEGGTQMSVYVTFYGWADNSPPGGSIAYPKSGRYPTVHSAAGGTGTYADPITFATDMAEIPVGTIVYVPFIEKYVVMEDDCVQCDTDWTSSRKWHIDLWMNSNGTESASSLATCEGNWTRASTVVEIGAPPGRTVTTRPLFDPSTNGCRATP